MRVVKRGSGYDPGCVRPISNLCGAEWCSAPVLGRPPSQRRHRCDTFHCPWRGPERRRRAFMRGWPFVTSIALVAGPLARPARRGVA
jgi:hypothetical protein